MKRQSASVFIVAIFTVAIIIIWSQFHHGCLDVRRSQAKVAPVHAEISPTPIEAARPVQDQRKQPEREERTRAVVRSIERTNVPIKFWGQVVDPAQQPIGGVNVMFSYSTEHSGTSGVAWAEQRIDKSQVTTNATGMFVVNGITGHSLTIEALQKEGYKYVARAAKTYNYYGDTSSGKFVPNADKPVVFVMTNDATAEPIVVSAPSLTTLRCTISSLPSSSATTRQRQR